LLASFTYGINSIFKKIYYSWERFITPTISSIKRHDQTLLSNALQLLLLIKWLYYVLLHAYKSTIHWKKNNNNNISLGNTSYYYYLFFQMLFLLWLFTLASSILPGKSCRIRCASNLIICKRDQLRQRRWENKKKLYFIFLLLYLSPFFIAVIRMRWPEVCCCMYRYIIVSFPPTCYIFFRSPRVRDDNAVLPSPR
jgi:hypothetical protein